MSTILVIDDSLSALQMAGMILESAGYQVSTCANGRRAVQMLRQETFDLILTDIYMPDADGLEVIREAHQICPGVPVVAMSGATGLRNMLAIAKYLGASQIVHKPFSKSDLLNAVATALDARCGGGPPARPARGTEIER